MDSGASSEREGIGGLMNWRIGAEFSLCNAQVGEKGVWSSREKVGWRHRFDCKIEPTNHHQEIRN